MKYDSFRIVAVDLLDEHFASHAPSPSGEYSVSFFTKENQELFGSRPHLRFQTNNNELNKLIVTFLVTISKNKGCIGY